MSSWTPIPALTLSPNFHHKHMLANRISSEFSGKVEAATLSQVPLASEHPELAMGRDGAPPTGAE